MDSKRLICIVSLDDKGERAYSMVEVALGKGTNSYCVAMHCRIQSLLAPLAAGVGIQRTAQTHTHTANKGLMWDDRAAIAPEHHNMNPTR